MAKGFSTAITVIVLAFAATLFGCGGEDPRVRGSWSGSLEGIDLTFSFYDDGRFEMKASDIFSGAYTEEGTFTAGNGRIAMTLDGEEISGTYTITGGTLKIDLNYDDGYSESFSLKRD